MGPLDGRPERQRKDEDRARHRDDGRQNRGDRREKIGERHHVLGLRPAEVGPERGHDEARELDPDTDEEQRDDRAPHAGGGFGGRAAHAGLRATEEPTHEKSLLKSTPSILPRDRRHRLRESVGAASASGRKNIILTSTVTPSPSTATRHGS